MSYWLVLEDGNGATGQIVTLTKPPDGEDDDGTLTLTDAGGILVGGDGDGLTLGGHLLTAEDLAGAKDTEGNLVTKIELENVPVGSLNRTCQLFRL